MNKIIFSENLPPLKLTTIMSFANLYTKINFAILYGKKTNGILQKQTVMIIKVECYGLETMTTTYAPLLLQVCCGFFNQFKKFASHP